MWLELLLAPPYLVCLIVLLVRCGKHYATVYRQVRLIERRIAAHTRWVPPHQRRVFQRIVELFDTLSITTHIALSSYVFFFFLSQWHGPTLLLFYRDPPRINLYTHYEALTNASTAASHTSPVRDPRALSPFEPRSAATAAFFCGRPTGSGYDGFAGAPHAAYVHHDMDHDRFVLRTFGRGGTRVDHRRRTGIGRSTYEAFCGAAPSAQVGTPLAPSPHTAGEANWQLDSAAALAWSGTGAFDFTVRRLATPAALESEPAATEDFTRADQGIRTHYRRYTRDELLDRHAHMDFIYSYVNGSDITRSYIKAFAKSSLCSAHVAAAKLLWSELRRTEKLSALREEDFSRHFTDVAFVMSGGVCALDNVLASSSPRVAGLHRLRLSLACAIAEGCDSDLSNEEAVHTLRLLFNSGMADDIDADSDELRHSMRGLLQHTRAWHRGRLSVVTPYANVPQWLNQTTNFFLRSLLADVDAQRSGRPRRDAAAVLGTADYSYVRETTTGQLHYSRMHVVDQRALMPPAPLTTVNSFAIEPFIYRLQNASGLFTFLNDDYLILRDIDIDAFVNVFGGPVLRIEKIAAALTFRDMDRGEFWEGLTHNSFLFNRDLDRLPTDMDELQQPFSHVKDVRGWGEKAPADGKATWWRTEWSLFTSVVGVRPSGSPPHRYVPTQLREESGVELAAMTAWTQCVSSASPGLRKTCQLPVVRSFDQRFLSVDAAAVFTDKTTLRNQSLWSGTVQLRRLPDWGRSTVERVLNDVVEERPYTRMESKSLQSRALEEDTKVAHRSATVNRTVRDVQDTLDHLNEPVDFPRELLQLLSEQLSSWSLFVRNSELPRNHLHKTPPRLRKYRLRFDSHAPYVQCRNMWNYIHTRHGGEMNENMLLSTTRSVYDFLPPPTHSAHLLRHPWAASYRYLPFLMAKAAWRLRVDGSSAMDAEDGEPPVFPVMDVALDNEDGCAPATYISEEFGDQPYNHFTDNERENNATMRKIRNYVDRVAFTNINSKFSQPRQAAVLRDFLEELFPTPMLLERHWQSSVDEAVGTDGLRVSPDVEGGAGDDGTATLRHLRTAFQKLTRLPLIVVSNDEEGFCPVLRSLRHAMPAFRGLRVVQVLVPPADGRSLHAARAEQRHAYRNFLPVTRCTLPAGRLVRVALPANSSVADVVVAGLRGAREGLAERHWAAPALVALRGLRAERRAVQAVVVDARTLHGGAAGFTELSLALATPAELLAHEDFAEVLLDGDAYAAAQPLVRRPTEEEAAQPASAVYRGEQVPAAKPADYVGSVLVLSHADAASRHVHWAHGASEHDLLSGMPLPHEQVEDMTATLLWGV